MTALSVQPPYPIFTDIDGQPLENGYVWIGDVNLDPQTNPIDVYWDAGLTIAAAQPIRTLAGYPSNNGTPARIYTGSDYSIRVQNKNGSVVYTSVNGNSSGGGFVTIAATGNGVQTIFPVSSIPSLIYINGVYQNQSTYSVANGNVTFSEAPPRTSIIEFILG